jgi:hypothetical protein
MALLKVVRVRSLTKLVALVSQKDTVISQCPAGKIVLKHINNTAKMGMFVASKDKMTIIQMEGYNNLEYRLEAKRSGYETSDWLFQGEMEADLIAYFYHRSNKRYLFLCHTIDTIFVLSNSPRTGA